MTSSPAETLLLRLTRVRQTGPGRWMASCPTDAHPDGDRSMGLAVRETEDGRVLVHCHAGCPTETVLAALGMSWGDLFPAHPESPALTGHRPPVPKYRPAELIDLAAHESLVCALVGADLLGGGPVSPEDLRRLIRAVETLQSIAMEVRHG